MWRCYQPKYSPSCCPEAIQRGWYALAAKMRVALGASVAIWYAALANFNFAHFSSLPQHKGGIWMTHVEMLPAKVLPIMLPWGHAETNICLSCKMEDGIEFIHGHLVLGGGQICTFFILLQHKVGMWMTHVGCYQPKYSSSCFHGAIQRQ